MEVEWFTGMMSDISKIIMIHHDDDDHDHDDGGDVDDTDDDDMARGRVGTDWPCPGVTVHRQGNHSLLYTKCSKYKYKYRRKYKYKFKYT